MLISSFPSSMWFSSCISLTSQFIFLIISEFISTMVDLESQTCIDDRLGVEIRPSNRQVNRVLPNSEGNERHTRYTSSVADWQGSHHTVETHRQVEWNPMSQKPNETVTSFLLSSTGAPKIGEDVVRTKYDAVTGPPGPLTAGKNLEIWGLRENPSLEDGES
jgi:hypothetical protein